MRKVVKETTNFLNSSKKDKSANITHFNKNSDYDYDYEKI
jgi:hypothetical protein